MIEVRAKVEDAARYIRGRGLAISARMKQRAQVAGNDFKRLIQRRYLSGYSFIQNLGLRRVTGRLYNSMRATAVERGTTLTVRVIQDARLAPYGKYHFEPPPGTSFRVKRKMPVRVWFYQEWEHFKKDRLSKLGEGL